MRQRAKPGARTQALSQQPALEAELPSCRLRPISATATRSSDGIFTKPANRRGQPPQPVTPETIERWTLTLKRAFSYLFSRSKKGTRRKSLRSKPAGTPLTLTCRDPSAIDGASLTPGTQPVTRPENLEAHRHGDTHSNRLSAPEPSSVGDVTPTYGGID